MIAGISRWDVGCVPELAEPELPLPFEPCCTQINFEPTLVHFKVNLPDLAVAPAFAHLPPAEFAALARVADATSTDPTIMAVHACFTATL
jgi:hypothetical protein